MQLSASALERYQKCPFLYYCNDILRLYQRQKMQMTGANSGSMVHFCLEQILRQYDKEHFLALSPEELKQEIRKNAAAYWQENMGGDFSKSGREQAMYHHAVSDVLPVLLHLQDEFRQSAFSPYCTELQITPGNRIFRRSASKPETDIPCGLSERSTVWISAGTAHRNGCVWWTIRQGKRSFSLGHLLYGLDMQMLIYLFSILSEGTALSDAQPAGVLYLPAGKVKSDQKRGASKTPEKKRNETYQMNGVLLRDAHLLTLMEQNGEGIYVPGKLDAKGELDTKREHFSRRSKCEICGNMCWNSWWIWRSVCITVRSMRCPWNCQRKTRANSALFFPTSAAIQNFAASAYHTETAECRRKKMMEILEELAEEENN